MHSNTKPVARHATESDFGFVYGLYFHPSINPFLLYEHMGQEEFAPIFESLLHQNVLFVLETGGLPVGMFKFVPLQHRNGHIAYIGGVAVAPGHVGKGLGKALMETVVQMALERGFQRLELSTATHNERAIKVYESAGFVKEGVLRNYTWLKSEGRFVDEVMMGALLPQRTSL